jgi:exonuclease VII small subunit
MVDLPAYILHLKSRIDNAWKHAVEANRQAQRALQEAQQQVRELSRKLAELTPPIA